MVAIGGIADVSRCPPAGARSLAAVTSPPLWGTARGEHVALIRKSGATPIDYQREDFTRVLPGGFDDVMRARHPAWFREDLKRLFGLLATRAIRSRVAERISLDEVAEAHRRLEAGGLEGKLVLCPDLPSRRDRMPPPSGPASQTDT